MDIKKIHNYLLAKNANIVNPAALFKAVENMEIMNYKNVVHEHTRQAHAELTAIHKNAIEGGLHYDKTLQVAEYIATQPLGDTTDLLDTKPDLDEVVLHLTQLWTKIPDEYILPIEIFNDLFYQTLIFGYEKGRPSLVPRTGTYTHAKNVKDMQDAPELHVWDRRNIEKHKRAALGKIIHIYCRDNNLDITTLKNDTFKDILDHEFIAKNCMFINKERRAQIDKNIKKLLEKLPIFFDKIKKD